MFFLKYPLHDKSVKYEDIMQVMQKLKENGYGKIALSSKKMD